MTTNGSPPPIDVGFAGPQRQRRLTVAFRLILAIPLFIVAALLGLVTAVVVIFSWIAALVLGRVPEGAARFITGSLRYGARMNAYMYLLTDRYPPFSLEPTDFPLSVIAQPGRLNRLAVLFRLPLAVPGYILSAILSAGVNATMALVWLIVLVAGQMPSALHQALASSIRYQTRFWGYFVLVSAAYPGGLFGDRPEQTTADASPLDAVAETFDAAEPAVPLPAATAPLATRLVLSQAARNLLVVFIVVGCFAQAGAIALNASTAKSLGALADLEDAYDRYSGSVAGFQSAVGVCGEEDVACVQRAFSDIAAATGTFASEVRSIEFPASAQEEATAVIDAAERFADVLRDAATSTMPDELTEALNRLAELGTQLDTEVARLAEELT